MTTPTHVEIDQIVLDENNPRIKQFTRMYSDSKLTEEQMLLALGAGAEYGQNNNPRMSYDRLKNSISASAGIIQPIILTTIDDEHIDDERYLCIEGNTRVAIYRQLRREEQEAGRDGTKWSTIPAIIDPNMDDREAHKIRLQVHLVGNRPWDAYSKAKYLHELKNDYQMPMSELVAFCGGSRNDVKQSLDAYHDMETHYRPILDDETSEFDPSRFSAFVELQKANVKDVIFNAGFDERDFSLWVNDRRISPLNSVRKLPKIFANKEAKRRFLAEGARDAIRILDLPDLNTTLREANISQLARAMLEKLQTLTYEEEEQIKADVGSDAHIDLKELLDWIKQMFVLQD